MRCKVWRLSRLKTMGRGKGRCMNTSDEDADNGRFIALQSLSNAQLIQILQFHDGDDELTEMVEEELERRKSDGAPPQ
jgi:hypothetical protein